MDDCERERQEQLRRFRDKFLDPASPKRKWRRLMKPPASAWAKQSAGQCAKAVPSFRMATGRNHGV